MEAARAGEQGEGFGIVADEVRRLAADSAEAAQRTDLLARAMLDRVGRSRESAARTLSTLQTVNDATHHGRQSFMQVEQGVIEAEKWSAAIESAVHLLVVNAVKPGSQPGLPQPPESDQWNELLEQARRLAR